MKKPKIFCTLGNTTDSKDTIAGMIKAGMRGARINTAYCTFKDYDTRISMLKEISSKMGINIPLMMDIKGPQLRILTSNPKMNYSIEKGIIFPVGFHDDNKEFKPYNDIDVYLNYNIKDQLKDNDLILIENGSIVTRVLENNNELYVEVINSGEGILRNKMGVNIPGKYLDLPNLSRKDEKAIEYTLKNNIEYIALSFVRNNMDLKYLQGYIRQRKKELGASSNPGLIAKIEDKHGFTNLDSIIEQGKGKEFDFWVMIARGDLFNEIPYSKLAYAQELISKKCRDKKVSFMIATGLLESMKYNPRPTRSEIGDLWNVLRDDPDYVLLSAETSNGKNPVLAVNTLNHIINEYFKI